MTLPRTGTGGWTRKSAAFLGREIDVAYEVKAGPTPAWLVLALPIGLASFALAGLSGVLLMAFIVVIGLGQLLWPTRILAVSDDRIWLMRASRFGRKPTELITETSRDRVAFSGGWPFPSVRVDGRRLWFQLPIRGAARRLPTISAAKDRS